LKKVIYISTIILGLGFVSCQKQDISPVSQEMEAPVWQEASDNGENARSVNDGNLRGGPEDTGVPIDPTGNNGGGGLSGDGEITDPMYDPNEG
jgi:hypothetical protein